MTTKKSLSQTVLRATMILMSLSIFSVSTAHAVATSNLPIKIVTTLPDIAEVVRTIGGPEVEVVSLLSGEEDPHFVDATPSLILKVARADVVCAMGLELESGWLPKVLAKSANAKVQTGGPGFCELGSSVTVLDRAQAGANRSMGDIHASGNPHFNLSPRAMTEGSRTVVEVLKRIRPSKADEFEARSQDFEKNMKRVENEVRAILKPAIELSKTSTVVIEYHKEFAYFFNLYGLKSFGAIEEKPGVPPSAGRLGSLANDAKRAGVRIALAGLTAPIKHVLRFSELSGIPGIRVPTGVHAKDRADLHVTTIEDLQKVIAKSIADAVKN